MENITIFNVEVSAWIYAPIIYFLSVTIFFIIKRIGLGYFRKIASRTKFRFDDILVESLEFPLTLLIFVGGIFVLERISPIGDDSELTRYFFVALRSTAIIAIILFLDKFLRALVRLYSDKLDILKTTEGITQGIIRVVVIGLGLLILLDSFGVSITPLLASLGVGSLAIALALQPTLENFFSGIQLIADKPIQVGHFVKLDSGEEGYVHKIGWRSSWVRMLPNSMVVIPNKVLVNSKVINYYYPDKEMAVLVQVGVHYNSDLEYVEQVTIDVGKEVMKTVQGGVPEFDPFIRYHTFNSSSIDFTVILRCKEFVDNYLIKHEFIKRLQKRYAKEGITIPFPIRAINYSQEGVQTEKRK